MNQLRLALLPTEVCLPFGQKQGCFQLTHWKSPEVSSTNRCHTFLFQKSAVGGMTVVPLQVEFGLQSTALLDLQALPNLTAHPICQDLVTLYNGLRLQTFPFVIPEVAIVTSKCWLLMRPPVIGSKYQCEYIFSSIMCKLLIEGVFLKFISLRDCLFTMSRTGNTGKKC